MMANDLKRAVAAEPATTAQWLADLVRIPTVNPPGAAYADLVAWLDERCAALGLTRQVHRVPDAVTARVVGDAAWPRLNLVARWDVGAPRTVHFNAHYDVVPAAGPWRGGDPFVPYQAGGHLYGRGTSDMKAAIAALLTAIAGLRRAGRQPAANVECSFTCDEETGGELGAGYLVRQGVVQADAVVVCEGAAGAHLGCGHNGVLWLDVEILGKAAHAARPQLGVNAFEQMAAVTVGLDRYRRRLASARRSWTGPDGQRRSPTLTLGGVFGGGPGDKINTVPARAHFSLDRRLVPGESVATVESELRQAVDAAAGTARCRVRSLLRIDPCVVDPASGPVAAFGRAIRAVRRCQVQPRITAGFTDLHYFVVDAGLPGVGYGVRGAGAHGRDERVPLADVTQTAQVYAHFLLAGLD